MKPAIQFIFFFLSFTLLQAQTNISGIVKERGVDVIIGANIFIENSFDGTSTALDGSFQFSTQQTGPVTLTVSYLGFKDYSRSLELTGEDQYLEIFLKPEANTLQEITITAGAFEAGDEKKAVVLNSIDIATTAGANADIATAFNTLPGTQRVGETGQLFVRGGAASETRTFIDGMYVQNPYNSSAPNVPARGRFSPFLFKGTTFSTGAYSAEFGQALSSALLLNTQDLAEETITSVSLMSVGLGLAHTQAWEETSIAVSADYTHLGPTLSALPSNIEFEKPFQGFSGQVIFRQKTSETGLLKAYVNRTSNDFSLYLPDFLDVSKTALLSLNNENIFTQVSYKEILAERWSIFMGAGYTENEDRIESNFGLFSNETTTQGKLKLLFDASDHVVLKMGSEFIHNEWQEDYRDYDGLVFSTFLNENYSSAFTEADIYVTRKLVARAGVRLEHSTLLSSTNFAPRFSVAYQLSDDEQISFATGRFYQTPENERMRYTTNLGFERADHFILNYQRIRNNRTFRIEAYQKNYDNLVQFDTHSPWLATNTGDGFARGVDVFYRDRKSIKSGDFWISYSFLDTKRQYLDFPVEATPTFASRHNLSVVYKHWISQLNSMLGCTYSYGSPRPYFNPNATAFLEDRTPAFNDLSLNWSYLTNLFGQLAILHVSASNILGLENTFGYQYSAQPNELGQFERRAIQPLTNNFFFVGLFVSIGKEYTITKEDL